MRLATPPNSNGHTIPLMANHLLSRFAVWARIFNLCYRTSIICTKHKIILEPYRNDTLPAFLLVRSSISICEILFHFSQLTNKLYSIFPILNPELRYRKKE
jgi:hypothetical protein